MSELSKEEGSAERREEESRVELGKASSVRENGGEVGGWAGEMGAAGVTKVLSERRGSSLVPRKKTECCEE